MKKFIAALVLALALSGFASAPVRAAAPAAPDFNANPVLSSIGKMGAHLYYMGKRYGMDGWFIVKDKQVQIAYATPDNKAAVIGALFGEDGENVSVLQVHSLVDDNKDVAALISNIKQEQAAISQVGSPSGAPAKPAAGDGLPAAPLSPGDRLMHDLAGSSSVVVGNPASPEIMMVMDPHCQHCQATWSAMRDAVIQGKFHLRMIPIGDKGSDNERAAAVLLVSGNPLDIWDKYVAGDHALLAGTPPAAALDAVRANHQIIDSWHIADTPYMVYRAKDGTVKIVVGEPKDLPALMADLGVQ